MALAFHAGAHLDHIEPAARLEPRLLVLHGVALVVFGGAAAWSLSKRRALRPR
jgi:hypothetical protein